ncbi:MAG TPA: MtrB/PioB family outer membrane beta-barrel protein, partial [Usitatibacter sp.]|nr:MtrB/PioB family outer membrane beta-barrel protein [Usitatibacter sp.]
MRRARLAVLAAAVLAALSAQAQLAGSAWVTGIGSNVSGANPFRFDEYRDLSSGATAGADVRCGNEAYWCTLFAENLGRDDQFAEARGGRYGLFKYGFFGNDTIHNLTHDAITPFEGVGTNRLTFDGALPLDTATWNGFDYSVKHRTFGGMFELRPYVSPFYARVEASRKESDGGRPIGGAGTSPGGPVYEMPVPVDWVTNNASVEAGYATRTAQLSVNAAWSRFDDHNDYVFWRNPIV